MASARMRQMPLIVGVLLTAFLSAAQFTNYFDVEARQACSKECGYGGEDDHGTRPGCGGEPGGNDCIYVDCIPIP